MKRGILVLAAAMVISSLFVGCGTIETATVKGYPGADRAPAELSTVTFRGSGFPDIYLYRVDGSPRTTAVPNCVGATYSDMRTLGFSVTLPAGKHVLEFYNVHKTPFDKSPLNYLSIAFSTEPGKTYELAHAGSSWQVKCDGQPVESTIGKVPVLKPPAPGEPQATLVFDRTDSLVVAYVFRIDGMIAPEMTYIEPRWVAFNTKGTMPMTIRNTSVPNIIHSPLVDPGYGKFKIPIAPGRHVLEYGTDYLPMAYRCMGGIVRFLEFQAEAGKTYLIKVDKSADESKSTDGSVAVIVAQ